MTTLPGLAVVVAVAILAALTVLQLLLVAGRPYGRLVWGGQHERLPPRLRAGSAVAVPVYVLVAWVLLARAGVLEPPESLAGSVGVATWVLVGFFAVSIAMNAISRSRPERVVMTPTCVVLTACSLGLALG